MKKIIKNYKGTLILLGMVIIGVIKKKPKW
jgi:phosphoribosyl-dephospho-CoA transferase